MINIIKSGSRGQANHGWLQSNHTFSFANYYNPDRMGFSHLLVINDDTVKAGHGFDAHGHRDMEIISYVLEGDIEHKDSQGNSRILPAGEFQLMSAGSGITHSEYNASDTQSLKFLQIWIKPNVLSGKPSYQQKDFGQQWGLTKVISPNGDGDSLHIKQNATLFQLFMQPNQHQLFTIEEGHDVYVHLIAGEIELDGKLLKPGDGAKVDKQSALHISSASDKKVQALIFELGK
ncbi:pirin family protein [uncultured Paraglaciecola sp.]|mgnify:FL=1|jgi:redox-sensitive bicupin YhaK (pirin superfamily)|uniref:pirin family protein n=1 Tax=uncultured Paraglaciecola sp. TaxID=1765024 RepID=UPI0025CDE489|nr:pirin family protein [uncultured Paraglaciecola sp.]